MKERAQYTGLDTIYKECDLITLHMPLLEDNFHLIGKEAISRMKDGVVIVNTARGGLIDTKALIEIRTPFYLNDLQGLIESSTEMYMPYSLYFFICEAPLESILNKEKVFEEIKRIQSDTRILEKMVLFMKNFEPHYNWLLGRINSF